MNGEGAKAGGTLVSVNYKRNEQFLNLKKVKVEMFG
jgi:hypothetical protein